METTSLVNRLTEKATEIGHLLSDLDASEVWKSKAAARSLPMMIRDIRGLFSQPIDDAPNGFYESLQLVVESIDEAAELVNESVLGRPSRGFGMTEGRRLIESLGFIATYAEASKGGAGINKRTPTRKRGGQPKTARNIAMAKEYNSGLEAGLWSNKTEFRNIRHNKMGRSAVSKAIKDGEERLRELNQKHL